MLAPVGHPVPDTPHAVSVSLPSWKAMVGYEESEDWVVSKMKTGYPRFFIHLTIQELEKEVLKLYGQTGEGVMLFPSQGTAQRCQAFLDDKLKDTPRPNLRTLHLEPTVSKSKAAGNVLSDLHCVFFPKDQFSVAKQVWQHSGDGISSRRGEFCLQALREGLLQPSSTPVTQNQQDIFSKGPRRYRHGGSQNGIVHNVHTTVEIATNGENSNGVDTKDYSQFVEERFGRNLNAKEAFRAKLAIRRRIAGCLGEDTDLDQALANSPDCEKRMKGLSEDDVYLYPTGMSSIFNVHRILMARRKAQCQGPLKSICFGFPYVDTLKILQKWGPGCLFYGNGMDEDLDDLEQRLESGERYLALFTEFPSNPLLRSPNLARIRKLADQYDFAVVVDETVGNYINLNVLPLTDVIVSSLTKVFSGDSNVMGGTSILNPQGRMYGSLKGTIEKEYEDNYWAEDAVFMERNSRDFISRIRRINVNAEAIADILSESPIVKNVYYPKLNPSRHHYDACKNPDGGYGGLLSVTFKTDKYAIAFFDSLQVEKGPSLGTNFTLACPYTILAHYAEIDWASQFGVERDLVRLSVGLEETEDIRGIVISALFVAEKS